MSSHLPVEKTEVYKKIVALSDEIWQVALGWPSFAQGTLGRQLVRAIDSVGANMVEGDGRFHGADSLHFFVIARGSLRGVCYWLERSLARGLITQEYFNTISDRLDHSGRSLNNLITYRRNSGGGTVREDRAAYGPVDDLRTPNTEHRTPAVFFLGRVH